MGSNGATFIPNVSSEGVISWTNDKNLDNPTPVNIKGPQGEKGEKGDKGDKGQDGTIANLDQTYNPTSTNAQSGKAVAEALLTKQDKLIAGNGVEIKDNVINVTIDPIIGGELKKVDATFELENPDETIDGTYTVNLIATPGGGELCAFGNEETGFTIVLSVTPTADEIPDLKIGETYRITLSGGEVVSVEWVIKIKVDQTYNPESENAQSGKAVAQAISTVGGDYELIEDITLTEDISQIERTVEPNGTPYNFRKVMVLYTSNAKVGEGNIQTTAFSNDKGLGLTLSKNTDTTNSDTSRFEFEANGVLKAHLTQWSKYSWVAGAVYGNPYIIELNENDTITKVKCSATTLPAGFNIKIYGVRA
jgi:hypothetical protein